MQQVVVGVARVSILRCDFAVAMEEEDASFGVSGALRAHFGLRGLAHIGSSHI